MEQKEPQYKTTGITMFLIGASLLIMRIIAYAISRSMANSSLAEWKQELVLDACFTIPSQVIFLFLATLLIYKVGLKKSVKEVFDLSGFKKPEWKKVGLSVLLGFTVYVGTLGVSAVWQTMLEIVGYTSSSADSILPDKFNFLVLVSSLILTAVLPAFCEEFAMRGIFAKTLDNSFSDRTVIILGGVAFGLFHQYIEQVVYTALFGMLVIYIAIRTGCIWYGIIIHFINNGISVYLSYAMKYDFIIGGNFDSLLQKASQSNAGIIMVYGIFAIAILLSIMIAKIIAPKKGPRLDVNGNRLYGKVVYKPPKKDNVWYIGAIAMSVLTTLFTFMFGYLA